jgi:alkylation response protein AidB-like acyl-CoA dehydrogenase
MSLDRARNRKQFGRAIGEFHLVKQKLAQMAETTFAMESLTYLCSGLIDRHAEDTIMETAICKLFCSEGSWQVIDDALQIWGGEGYMREHGLERMLRDARINRIVEGATEVMTAFVALMGMKGVGEDLEGVMRQFKHPVDNFGRLASFARGQFRDVVIGHDLAGVHPKLAAEGHALAQLTKVLARDVIRLLGKHREAILDLELLHERLAWAVIEMYAMAATISRMQMMIQHAESNGNGNGHAKELERNLTIGKSFCHHAAQRVRRRLGDLFSNLDRDTLRSADAALGWDGAPSEKE